MKPVDLDGMQLLLPTNLLPMNHLSLLNAWWLGVVFGSYKSGEALARVCVCVCFEREGVGMEIRINLGAWRLLASLNFVGLARIPPPHAYFSIQPLLLYLINFSLNIYKFWVVTSLPIKLGFVPNPNFL
jgi:hypothetical protein